MCSSIQHIHTKPHDTYNMKISRDERRLHLKFNVTDSKEAFPDIEQKVMKYLFRGNNKSD